MSKQGSHNLLHTQRLLLFIIGKMTTNIHFKEAEVTFTSKCSRVSKGKLETAVVIIQKKYSSKCLLTKMQCIVLPGLA